MDPYVIAEIGQGKGDPAYVARALARAHQSGCWGGKIQLLQPDRIAQVDAPVYWRERRPEIDGQRATFQTAGCLDYAELPRILDAADRIGIHLVATPFDLAAVAAMARYGVQWCKIASGDITNRPLVEACADAFPHTIILSTGAATLPDIAEALEWIADGRRRAAPWAVLACTLSYPTQERDANLGRIATLKAMRDQAGAKYRVGYSDHLVSPGSSLHAVLAGAQVLEKHYTLDDSDRSVPDNAFAVGPLGMDTYVAGAAKAAELLGDGQLLPADAEMPARTGARRVLCAVADLPAGAVVRAQDVIALRPLVAGAFTPADLPALTGRVLRDPVAAGTPIPMSAVI